MDFGISFPSYIRAYHDAKMAEDYGFSHAWFYDSHMLFSDVYVAMALAAEHTRHIKIGSMVSILGNRIAPITAHSIATVNELAPGRVILGVGTGFGARNAMGMPPTSLKTMREHIAVIRDLLSNKEATYREGDIERHIRFLHQPDGYINLRDDIPIYMAANGPKGLALTGELADGWVTVGLDPEYVSSSINKINRVREGHSDKPLYTVNVTSGCVLRPGEDITSARVAQQVGPYAILALHTNWDPKEMSIGPFAPPAIAPLAQQYFDEHVMQMDTPMDRRYQEMHAGHLMYLRKGEDKYLSPELLKLTTLTGSPGDIIDRIHALADVGVSNITLNVCGTDARALIREFGNEIIPRV